MQDDNEKPEKSQLDTDDEKERKESEGTERAKEIEDDERRRSLGCPRVEYDEAFDLTGYGRLNHLALFACLLIYVYCSQEMTGLAYVLDPAECDISLDVTQKSMLNAGVFIGVVATSICWGIMSDRFGRRRVMIPTMVGSMIASFLSSLCTKYWTMFLFRTITGCLIAASSSTVLVYLGEMHAKRHRDRAISIAIASDQVNFVIFPAFAWLIIPASWSFKVLGLIVRPWRVFMWLWAISGIIGTTILYILPESPRFVLATEGEYQTLVILGRIYAFNKRKRSDDYPVKNMKYDMQSLTCMKKDWRHVFTGIGILSQPPLRRCYILTHFCMFLVNLLANGLYMWMPSIINDALKDSTRKEAICYLLNTKYLASKILTMPSDWLPHTPHSSVIESSDCSKSHIVSSSYLMSILMELLYLVPFVLVIILVNKINPIKLYAIIMSTCAISLVLCSIVPNIIAATFFIALGLCSGACASLLSSLAVDAFPTRLRALAMCTMFMVGEVGTIFGIFTVSMMREYICVCIFFIIAILVVVSVISLNYLWPNLNTVRDIMERRHFTY